MSEWRRKVYAVENDHLVSLLISRKTRETLLTSVYLALHRHGPEASVSEVSCRAFPRVTRVKWSEEWRDFAKPLARFAPAKSIRQFGQSQKTRCLPSRARTERDFDKRSATRDRFETTRSRRRIFRINVVIKERRDFYFAPSMIPKYNRSIAMLHDARKWQRKKLREKVSAPRYRVASEPQRTGAARVARANVTSRRDGTSPLWTRGCDNRVCRRSSSWRDERAVARPRFVPRARRARRKMSFARNTHSSRWFGVCVASRCVDAVPLFVRSRETRTVSAGRRTLNRREKPQTRSSRVACRRLLSYIM